MVSTTHLSLYSNSKTVPYGSNLRISFLMWGQNGRHNISYHTIPYHTIQYLQSLQCCLVVVLSCLGSLPCASCRRFPTTWLWPPPRKFLSKFIFTRLGPTRRVNTKKRYTSMMVTLYIYILNKTTVAKRHLSDCHTRPLTKSTPARVLQDSVLGKHGGRCYTRQKKARLYKNAACRPNSVMHGACSTFPHGANFFMPAEILAWIWWAAGMNGVGPCRIQCMGPIWFCRLFDSVDWPESYFIHGNANVVAKLYWYSTTTTATNHATSMVPHATKYPIDKLTLSLSSRRPCAGRSSADGDIYTHTRTHAHTHTPLSHSTTARSSPAS